MTGFRVDDSPEAIAMLRTMRLLVLGMCQGVVLSGVMAWYLVVVSRQVPVLMDGNLIATIAALVGAASLVLSGVFPRIIERHNQAALRGSRPEPESVLSTFRTRLILECALLEGGAFFNLTAFILNQQWWSVAIATVLILVIASKFPTRFQMENFVREQLELIELDSTRNRN